MLTNFARCGLNADWNCDAWHLGPSATPNMNSGDFYILEDEEQYGKFFLVQTNYDGTDVFEEDVVELEHGSVEECLAVWKSKAN